MGKIVSNLATEFGLDTLPAEKQQQILDRIGTIIYQAVLMRAYDILTETQKAELEKKLEGATDNAEVLFTFLAANIPNFEHIVEEEIARFRAESMDLFRSLA